MNFEWDRSKAKKNLAKHSVDFADAVSVFDDLNALTLEDHTQQEKRFISIGIDNFSRLLVVIFTWRSDAIRIISARKATKKEQKQYGEVL